MSSDTSSRPTTHTEGLSVYSIVLPERTQCLCDICPCEVMASTVYDITMGYDPQAMTDTFTRPEPLWVCVACYHGDHGVSSGARD